VLDNDRLPGVPAQDPLLAEGGAFETPHGLNGAMVTDALLAVLASFQGGVP
jgi:hypothetical protein